MSKLKPINEFEANLLEDGFKMYLPRHKGEVCTASFQKCYRDEKGNKKYFVDCYRWDFTKFKDELRTDIGISYEYETQLYRAGDHAAINLSFINGNEWTVNTVSEFINKLFEAGQVENYEDID